MSVAQNVIHHRSPPLHEGLSCPGKFNMDALLVNPLNYSLELLRDELGPKPYILQEFASDTMCLFRFGVATRSGGGATVD